MEERGSQSRHDSTQDQQNIVLHVLSPSSEVPNKITFPIIHVSTTIGELKTRIREAIPTRPAPERQRLIYRGKALTQDATTLKDVFTQDIINSSEALSLHLVLPPTTVSTPLLAVPNQIPSHNDTSQSPMPSRPTSAMQSPGAQQPPILRHSIQHTIIRDGQVLVPQPFPMVPQNMPLSQGPLPPHLQNVLNNHLTALSQQVGAQFGTQFALGAQNQPTFMPDHQSHLPQQSFQQAIAQQQQARAALGMQGVGYQAPGQDAQRNSTPFEQRGPFLAPGNSQNSTTVQGNTSTSVYESQGPNGEHRRVVVETTPAFPSSANSQNQAQAGIERTTLHASNATPPRISTPGNGSSNPPHFTHVSGIPAADPTFAGIIDHRSQVLRSSLILVHQRLSSLETTLASGLSPPESEFMQVRTLLRGLISQQNHLGDGVVGTLQTRLNNLSIQAGQLRAHPSRSEARIGSEQTASPSASQVSTVYVLSSPTGPQALLFSPSGSYGTAMQNPTTMNGAHIILHQPPEIAPTRTINVPIEVNAQQPPGTPANVEQAQEQNQQQEQVNQVRDLVRLLLPLGGHLWLMLRLLGFVYFFANGGGWRRTVLLGICAILMFLSQSFFQPVVEMILGPLRRHVEGLLPIAGNDRPAVRENPNGNDISVGRSQGFRQAAGEPTPEEAAARLLQERDSRIGSIIRQNLRRVERAVALFVASLIPGVGERHIAARNVAEAVRGVERMEREARARQEEEERRQPDSVADPTSGGHQSGETGNHSEPAQEPNALQPLVEV